MAITREQAVNSHPRQEFHTHASSGKIYRVRVSGKCQTWAPRPNEFKLPVKYGLYQSYYITHENAHEWHLGGNPNCQEKHS